MTEAVFGLVGVIVGAVLTGGIQWWMARRSEKALLRTAARLIQVELRGFQDLLDLWLSLKRIGAEWWKPPEYWPAQRGVLAAGLSRENWTTVSDAYEELQRIENGITDIEQEKLPENRLLRYQIGEEGSESRTSLQMRRDRVHAAIKCLYPVADLADQDVIRW
jgi:hypothetical protein